MENGVKEEAVVQEEVKKAAPAGVEEFMDSGYYKSLGVDRLESRLDGYQMDDEALRKEAEARYAPTYEAEIQGIRQELERQIQGYGSQIGGMEAAYDRQRRMTDEAYDESRTELENELTKRGLGRSSLVSAQGAYLENKRNQALEDISIAETNAVNAINERIALLTEQAARSERTLADNYARQLEKRISDLKEQNRTASVSLQLQIAALQQQGYEAYQKWLAEEREQAFREQQYADEQAAKSSKKSSSSKKKTTAAAAPAKTAAKKETASAVGSAVVSSLVGAVGSALKNLWNKGRKSTGASSGGSSKQTSSDFMTISR